MCYFVARAVSANGLAPLGAKTSTGTMLTNSDPVYIAEWHLTLQWRHNGHNGVSNHQPYDCLLNRLFGRRWKKTWKLRVTGLCVGNSPVTGEFPAQMASNAEKSFHLITSSWNS